jgi:hypothetical protein
MIPHFTCLHVLPLLEQSFCVQVKRPYSRLRGNDKPFGFVLVFVSAPFPLLFPPEFTHAKAGAEMTRREVRE